MLVEEHTYIPLFGRWCEVCMFVDEHTYIHTYLRLGAGVRYVCSPLGFLMDLLDFLSFILFHTRL